MFKKTQYVQSFKDLKSEREFYGISKKGFIFVFLKTVETLSLVGICLNIFYYI